MPPKSATSFAITLSGLAALLLATWVLRALKFTDLTSAAIILLASCAVPIIALECHFLKVHRRFCSGNSYFDWKRLLIKGLGLAATLAVIAFSYWLLPEYADAMYAPFWEMLAVIAPYALPLAAIYFVYVDSRQSDPEDGYYHAGLFVLRSFYKLRIGGQKVETGAKVKLIQYALGWLVKAFFLPIMYVFFYRDMEYLLGTPDGVFDSLPSAYEFLQTLAIFIDVAFAVVGYTLTLRLFDSHIRSTDGTTPGWLAALICYPPFWGAVTTHYLSTDLDQAGIFFWLGKDTLPAYVFAGISLAAIYTYAFSTVVFGVRFSNLTHRGIITGGPYRFSKHPAYIAKNLHWWLSALPFMAFSWISAVKSCLLLMLVGVVYYIRARTEERHLSRDPLYVQYAMWIERNGILRFLSKVFPGLRFKALGIRD